MPGLFSTTTFLVVSDVAVWILAPTAAHDPGPQPPQAGSNTLFPVRAAEARRGVPAVYAIQHAAARWRSVEQGEEGAR